jgi:hypothetical protein
MAKRKNPAAVALGRRGGKVRSAAKTAANQRNAQRAGRRPKFAPGDRVRVRLESEAPAAQRGQLVTVAGAGDRTRHYRVRLADGAVVEWPVWWLIRAENGPESGPKQAA